ncbi:Fer-1-Like Protein 4 [Manis pentadactyla]|nr:Fer-1-Like Protein 4 [Manis pentadactyla]
MVSVERPDDPQIHLSTKHLGNRTGLSNPSTEMENLKHKERPCWFTATHSELIIPNVHFQELECGAFWCRVQPPQEAGVMVFEAQKLVRVNINPYVAVHVGEQRPVTATQRRTNCTFYDEYFLFDLHETWLHFQVLLLEITAFHSQTLPFIATRIGTFRMDLGIIFDQPGTNGFLKVTVSVKAHGDLPPSLPPPGTVQISRRRDLGALRDGGARVARVAELRGALSAADARPSSAAAGQRALGRCGPRHASAGPEADLTPGLREMPWPLEGTVDHKAGHTGRQEEQLDRGPRAREEAEGAVAEAQPLLESESQEQLGTPAQWPEPMDSSGPGHTSPCPCVTTNHACMCRAAGLITHGACRAVTVGGK